MFWAGLSLMTAGGVLGWVELLGDNIRFWVARLLMIGCLAGLFAGAFMVSAAVSIGAV